MGLIASPVSGDWYGVPRAWCLVAAAVVAFAIFTGLNALTNRKYVFVDGVVCGVFGRMGSGKSLFAVLRVLLPFCRGLSRGGGVVYSKTGRPVRRAIVNFRFDPEMPNVEIRTVQPTSEISIWRRLRELAEEIGAVEGPWYDEAGIQHDGRKPPPDLEPVWLEQIEAWAYVRQPILNGLIFIDEMHLYNASSKLAQDPDCEWFCSMIRKLNALMLYASQNEMKVHKRLRDETSEFWLAGELVGPLTWLIGSGWHVCRQYVSSGQLAMARDKAGTDRAPRAADRRRYRFTRRAARFYNSFELLVPDPSRRSAGSPRVGPKRDLSLVDEETADVVPAEDRQPMHYPLPVGSAVVPMRMGRKTS